MINRDNDKVVFPSIKEELLLLCLSMLLIKEEEKCMFRNEFTVWFLYFVYESAEPLIRLDMLCNCSDDNLVISLARRVLR